MRNLVPAGPLGIIW